VCATCHHSHRAPSPRLSYSHRAVRPSVPQDKVFGFDSLLRSKCTYAPVPSRARAARHTRRRHVCANDRRGTTMRSCSLSPVQTCRATRRVPCPSSRCMSSSPPRCDTSSPTSPRRATKRIDGSASRCTQPHTLGRRHLAAAHAPFAPCHTTLCRNLVADTRITVPPLCSLGAAVCALFAPCAGLVQLSGGEFV
jgi:hypothetical protein